MKRLIDRNAGNFHEIWETQFSIVRHLQFERLIKNRNQFLTTISYLHNGDNLWQAQSKQHVVCSIPALVTLKLMHYNFAVSKHALETANNGRYRQLMPIGCNTASTTNKFSLRIKVLYIVHWIFHWMTIFVKIFERKCKRHTFGAFAAIFAASL